MDALSGSAATFIKLDEQNQFRIPTEIRALGGVVDVRIPYTFPPRTVCTEENGRNCQVQSGRALTFLQAYFFNLIGFFPPSSAYYAQSNNQKGQVDTHFHQAVHAYHLTAALSPKPYANISST
jgi:hypothetical protein